MPNYPAYLVLPPAAQRVLDIVAIGALIALAIWLIAQ